MALERAFFLEDSALQTTPFHGSWNWCLVLERPFADRSQPRTDLHKRSARHRVKHRVNPRCTSFHMSHGIDKSLTPALPRVDAEAFLSRNCFGCDDLKVLRTPSTQKGATGWGKTNYP